MSSRTNILLRIAIGILMPIILIVLGLFHIVNLKIVIGIVMIIIAVYVFHSLNVRPDERTKKLNTFAVKLSWLFTYCFLMIFYFISKFIELGSSNLIALIFFFMVYSYWIIKFVVNGMSDVPE